MTGSTERRNLDVTGLDDVLAFIQGALVGNESGLQLSAGATRGLAMLIGVARSEIRDAGASSPAAEADHADGLRKPLSVDEMIDLMWTNVETTDLCLFVQAPAEGGVQSVGLGGREGLVRYLKDPDQFCAAATGCTVEEIRRYREINKGAWREWTP